MKTNDSILFSPAKIGGITIKNRFVRSATYEGVANEDGTATEAYLKIYELLARGHTGLIITGMIYTDISGRSYPKQAGLHSDKTIDRLSEVTEAVHQHGSAIFAQLVHGGRQTEVGGIRPKAPSATRPDLIYQVYPRAMHHQEIVEAVKGFGEAAKRARKAGFDGIQIHGAHGYLVSQFLSPFFNRRNDEWGGSPEKRFLFLKRVYETIREAVGADYPVIVKINVDDHTPKPGLSIEEVAGHIKRLVEMGIDAVEISCGTLSFSMFKQIRGNVPVRAFAKTKPLPIQPVARLVLKNAFPEKRFAFEEAYNLWACRYLKASMGNVPLILVGGMRNFQGMGKIVAEGEADFISMCRPFIAQPMLVKQWEEGNEKPPVCVNCNNCLGGLALQEPLRCNRNRVF
ncbi:oxidoreductase [Desulfosudis oleivorans]|uniref:NADH:flavin oxidoreductase/NADH oxidase n=1 Tax=Desulfosudis oleivorans (strain DSM 6200 / JCM 39069 / Hxd3) TaxID=96561 RepID=A8ZZE7_DESOH|nr:NADH:flavin oxidoreductase [Desulfosudis oleivorans]ABW67300.1 NADH:flavin oxidoreductase/NADH oxidase [Desulfosudis oleivorans Hxd3]